MLCYRDRCYCIREDCTNKLCHDKLTKEVKRAAERARLPIDVADLCNGHCYTCDDKKTEI